MAPRLGVRVMGHLGARVSSPSGVKGAVSQAWGSRSFSRRVLHLDLHAWPTSGRARRRDGIPASTPPFIRAEQTTVVLSACCNEGSIAVNRGTPRCRPSAGQRASPGMVDRFPSFRSETNNSDGTSLRGRLALGLGGSRITLAARYPIASAHGTQDNSKPVRSATWSSSTLARPAHRPCRPKPLRYGLLSTRI
jgi:hypothetical protein